MVYLARCYACGYGVQENLQEAAYWYEKAAQYDNVYALTQAAYCYYVGRGVIRDEAKALTYYQRGAALGDIDCKVSLAVFYLEGRSIIKQDIQQGLNLLHEGATKKNGTAYFKLYLFYDMGQHVEKDTAKAFEYLESAAQQKLPEALFELGRKLIIDEKLPENYMRGIQLIKEAAESRFEPAIWFMKKTSLDTVNNSTKTTKLTSGQLQHTLHKPKTDHAEPSNNNNNSLTQNKEPSNKNDEPYLPSLKKGFFN